MEKKLHFHHIATRLGYVGKNAAYDEPYKGRFGEGIIKHIPNLLSRVRSTRYHDIIYFTYK